MKFRRFTHIFMMLLMMMMLIFTSCRSSESATEEKPSLKVMASDNEVTILHENSSELLEPQVVKELAVSDQVTVDDFGRALLAIADSVLVELIRDGELTVREATIDDQTLLLTLALNSGTVLNDLNVGELVDARLTIQGEFASVSATGTTFMVIREENTPLEWVVALEAGENDLTITGDNSQEIITAGEAVWVAPDGNTGPVVEANMEAIKKWVTEARISEPTVDLGEIVWAPAAVSVSSGDLPENMPTGKPISVHEITLWLDPSGNYQWADCNGDGVWDIHSENGRFEFDLTQVIGQKRAIDMQVVNGNPLVDTILTGYNPGYEIIPGAVNAAAGLQDAPETLSLRSEVQPFHFAELVVEDGCFVGVALVPPETETGMPPTITPTFTPTHTPTATTTPTPTPYVCQPSPLPGWVMYTVKTGDTLGNLGQRTGSSVAAIQQVNCLTGTMIYAGQTLWLPFIPPTFTPTCSNLNFSARLVNYSDYYYEDLYVILDTINFPANVVLDVWVARADGSGGTSLGQVATGHGSEPQRGFDIPYEYESLPYVMIGIDSESPCYTGNTVVNYIEDPTVTEAFSIDIIDVNPDDSVSIRTYNAPAKEHFVVTMGPMGTQGINGIKVGDFYSGGGGSIDGNFPVPPAYHGSVQIAIRIESAEGYYAHNWFENVSVEPCNFTFQITDVTPNSYVSITTYGIPADQNFDVFMYDNDPYSAGEYYADTFYSKGGGYMEIGSSIPSELYGAESIGVKLASRQDCTASNWFNNHVNEDVTPGIEQIQGVEGTMTSTPTSTNTPTSTPTITPTSPTPLTVTPFPEETPEPTSTPSST